MANSTLRGKALFKAAGNATKISNSFAGKIGPTHPLAKQMYGDVLVLVDSLGTLLHPISSDPTFRKKARWFGRNITTGSKNAIALTAAVIGGIGNIRGAFFGGLSLGLVEVYASSILGTEWKSVTVFIILVLVLVLKPNGIFGEAVQQTRA